MRKALLFLIMIAIVISATGTITLSAENEVIFFDSFETGLEKWTTFSSKTSDKHNISDCHATDGKKSLYIIDESEELTSGVVSEMVEAIPNTKYSVVADFIDVLGTVKLYIKFYNSEKKQVDSKSVGAKEGNGTSEVSGISSAEASYVGITIATNGSTLGTGYVDNVKLIKGKTNEIDIKTNELISKLGSARAGDVIEIEDGVYTDVNLVLNENATLDNPVVIKAKNPGKVIFKGQSYFTVKGSGYVFSGLRFEECTGAHIITFDVPSSDCIISECAFLNNHPETGNQFWVKLRGKSIQVKDSFFSGKQSVGQFIEAAKHESTKTTQDNHVISGCYFGNIKFQGTNGFEAIRLGLSQTCFESANIILEGCFFEKCDGEVETISVKSNDNIIRYNTLYNCKGAVVLRHGDNNSVYGNLFVGGESSSRAHGVRVTGERQKVYNNYFYNLPVLSTSLILPDGCPYEGIQNDWYYPVVDFNCYNNTFVGGDKVAVIGEYSPSNEMSSNRIIPPQGKMFNNAIISFNGENPIFTKGDPGHKIEFENNYAYGKALGDMQNANGINYKYFDYQIVDNLVVPANGLGADIMEIKKVPLSPYDVICDWVKKEFYDTGIYKFEPVESDPFNTGFKVENLLPDKDKINVILNGEKVNFDVEPQLINSRTMVPMRAIFEKFGAEINWDEKTATATAKTEETEIKITENKDVAYVNNKEIKLDSSAVIIDGRFLVPVRFISESFGAKVDWAEEAQTVIVTYDLRKNNIDNNIYSPKHNTENALTVYKIKVGGFHEEGNEVRNALDGVFTTKWTSKPDDNGVKPYGIFDFGEEKTLDKLYMAYSMHNTRVYSFEVYVSKNNIDYTLVIPETYTTKKDGSFEIYDLNGESARYVKIVCFGNNDNTWSNISEIIFTGK